MPSLSPRLWAAFAFMVAAVGLTTAQDATPQAADVKKAVETLRDVYEKDYAAADKNPKDGKALAQKLYDGAAKRKTAAMIYASYNEARRLAAEAGEARLAFDALAALAAKFKDAPTTLQADTLKTLSEAELTATQAKVAFTVATELANKAIEKEDYANAVALGKILVAAADKVDEGGAEAEAKAFLKRAEELAEAVATLKKKPTDPDANETLGKYWVFTRDDWKIGLKYLAQGADASLKTAAVKDIAEPKTAKDCTALADLWYKIGKDAKGAEQKATLERAWEWYKVAIALAKDDEDLKPSERVKEIEAAYPTVFDKGDKTLTGHTAAVAAIAATPDGKTLVSVSNDHSVRIWALPDGKAIKTLDGHIGWVGSVVVAPDGTKAITAGGDNIIRIWDLKTNKEIKALEGHAIAIRGLAITGDGKTLVSGGSDKTCRLWDLTTYKELKKLGDEKNAIESVAITSDGRLVLAGNDAAVVTVYDAKTGDVVSKYEKHDKMEGNMIFTLAVTRDGKTAVSGARDKNIHIWDVASGKQLRTLAGHTEQVYQVALSPNDKTVASASFDKSVRLWDLASGKELKKFDGHSDGVQGVCFGGDGRTIFSASWDKSIRKWRVPALLGPVPPVKK